MTELRERVTDEEKQEKIKRQIRLAELELKRKSGRTLEEVVVAAMGRFGDDREKAAESLLNQRVFEETTDCPNPGEVASAAVGKFFPSEE